MGWDHIGWAQLEWAGLCWSGLVWSGLRWDASWVMRLVWSWYMRVPIQTSTGQAKPGGLAIGHWAILALRVV